MMSIRILILVVASILILAANSGKGVAQIAGASHEANAVTTPVPVIRLKFETAQVPIALPSLVVAGLPLCGFKDSELLEFAMPPNYVERGLYSITAGKEVRTFSIADPTDKKLLRSFLQFDANDSGAYILTSTMHRFQKDVSENGDQDDTGDSMTYDIVRYDDQGQLKETNHLDLHLRPIRFGVFPNGDFLVLGIDNANLTPQAVILHSDGTLRAYVDLWNALPSNDALAATVPKGFDHGAELMKLSIGLGAYRIGHTATGLALFRQDTSNKIILVSSSGAVSTVTVQIPKGYAVDSFVESDKRWLLRVNSPDSDSDGKFQIFEFRSDDGVLMSEINTAPAPSSGFACERDGEFRLVHWIDKKPYLETAKPQ